MSKFKTDKKWEACFKGEEHEEKQGEKRGLPTSDVVEPKQKGYESVLGHALRTEGPRVAELVVLLGLSK